MQSRPLAEIRAYTHIFLLSFFGVQNAQRIATMQLQRAVKSAELGPGLDEERQLTTKSNTLQWRNSSHSPLFRLHISILGSCKERQGWRQQEKGLKE